MQLRTTSEVISLATSMENESARFYESLSQEYVEQGGFFLSLEKENRKNVTHIQRTYYGVISDAIEGCFAFKLETDDYTIDTVVKKDTTYHAALSQAIEIEERIAKYYSQASEQSASLMADLPRIFKMIARKRNDRRSKLKVLLDGEG